ncbi:transposase family protein [Nostoc commune]|uniref:transposase family protein n=1 Tax=Nostoc commune TaxID=1178 RepID=UPI0018C5727B|nr:transposase family protein [Nostoc commune]MBG1258413.1 transposase family protein [Nostoc commune BAE]
MMISPLVKIESYPQSAKRLIGINYEQFITLVALTEQRHKQKQTEFEKTTFVVRIIASGDGRKPKMSPKERICLCLVDLRQKPTFDNLGLLFDISKIKANFDIFPFQKRSEQN